MVKVLFVCMGNICRSPMAEGVFHKLIKEAGLEDQISIDSAGTHSYHVGDSPDQRAQAALRDKGIDISGLRGRQVADDDFEEFDYIVAMDSSNLNNLKRRAATRHHDKIQLMLSFSRKYPNLDVPDPYYGGADGFKDVLKMVEDGGKGLLKEIQQSLVGEQR
ncbi:MAG: low molecular weight protein-tyrosine-phosphatase [Thiobacillaceae bacterium]|jgi:protein-tyrosine phosphatase